MVARVICAPWPRVRRRSASVSKENHEPQMHLLEAYIGASRPQGEAAAYGQFQLALPSVPVAIEPIRELTPPSASTLVDIDLHITAGLGVPEGAVAKICHQLLSAGSVGREWNQHTII